MVDYAVIDERVHDRHFGPTMGAEGGFGVWNLLWWLGGHDGGPGRIRICA
jgi:hypothetical protein